VNSPPNPTEMTPQEQLDDAIERRVGDPVATSEIELQARHDYIALLTHTARIELLELVRLYKKLQDRGGKLGPIDTLRWSDIVDELEAERRGYVRDFKRYDAPQVIFQTGERFAGNKIAVVIESAMASWRERLWAEAIAAQERKRGGAPV
jgi:hypothetical protein